MDSVVDSVAVSIAEDFGAAFGAVIEVGMVVDVVVGSGTRAEEALVVEEEKVGMVVVFLVDMAVSHPPMRRLDRVAALVRHMDPLGDLVVRRMVS